MIGPRFGHYRAEAIGTANFGPFREPGLNRAATG